MTANDLAHAPGWSRPTLAASSGLDDGHRIDSPLLLASDDRSGAIRATRSSAVI